MRASRISSKVTPGLYSNISVPVLKDLISRNTSLYKCYYLYSLRDNVDIDRDLWSRFVLHLNVVAELKNELGKRMNKKED